MDYICAKTLYPQIAVLKAAYAFTDKAYIFIDQCGENIIVHFDAKDATDVISEREFKNELLEQAMRFAVNEQTKDIRKLIVARALASTIIEDDGSGSNAKQAPAENEFDISKILVDWYANGNT